jgi:hypothetical protein
MFSPEMYFRLYELHNAALWPATPAAGVLGLGLIWLTRRAGAARGRVVSALIAVAWAVVAWWFFHRLYAGINLAAPWFAVGFGVQAAVLLGVGAVAERLQFDWGRGLTPRLGLALLVFAVAVHPLIGPLAGGRDWRGAELFGLAPDPTALGTLGLLLMTRWRHRWALGLLPLLWCLASGLTWLAMDLPHGLLPPALGLLAAAALPLRR